jgi:phosphoglucosamine mutase
MALGIHVILTGPIPTAVIPFLMKERDADLGINISASHNPFNDNGIKIFGSDGRKLSDEIELQIEKILLNEDEFKYNNLKYSFIDSKKIGYLSRIHNAPELYSQNLQRIFSETNNQIWRPDFSNLKIVVDVANGAAYKIAPMILSVFGIQNFILINNKPDGFNINFECGAVHTKKLSEAVIANKADIGFAVDGDADRIVFVDERGIAINNDKILAFAAKTLNDMGLLKKSKLVINISSNSGIEKYLSDFGVFAERVPVGDKYLLDAFKNQDLNFGGEQSGHIIFPEFMIGGDGLLSGILILCLILKKIKDDNCDLQISRIFDEINLLPQISKNFNYESNFDLSVLNSKKLLEKLSEFEKNIQNESNGYGRILIRKSGTEKKIRLIGEGESEDLIEGFLNNIINFFKSGAFL